MEKVLKVLLQLLEKVLKVLHQPLLVVMALRKVKKLKMKTRPSNPLTMTPKTRHPLMTIPILKMLAIIMKQV